MVFGPPSGSVSFVNTSMGVAPASSVTVAASLTAVGGVSVVIDNDQPPPMVPSGPPTPLSKSSTTYRDHVPFGFVPLKPDSTAPYGPPGAGDGKASGSTPAPPLL